MPSTAEDISELGAQPGQLSRQGRKRLRVRGWAGGCAFDGGHLSCDCGERLGFFCIFLGFPLFLLHTVERVC